MICPECQTKYSEVKQTRRTKDGYVRYRICFNGHRFRTIEIVKEGKDD